MSEKTDDDDEERSGGREWEKAWTFYNENGMEIFSSQHQHNSVNSSKCSLDQIMFLDIVKK